MIVTLSEMELGHLISLVNREILGLKSGLGLSCRLCNFTASVDWRWPSCTHDSGPALKCPSCGEDNRHWHRFGELESLRARLEENA